MSATPPTAPPARPGAPRRWRVPLAALALVATGCGLPGSGPDADEAARALATALSKGSVASVPFTGDAPAARREYAAVTDGLARLGRPRVTAGGTSTDGDTGRSTLRWRWTVGEEDWSYQTRVDWRRAATSDGDVWSPRWTPSLVEPSLRAGEALTTTGIAAARGDVLGAGGRPLVTPRPVLRVGLDKSALPSTAPGQARASATRLARLVGIDATAFARQAVQAGAKAFVPAIVYRRADAPAEVTGALASIPGARAISDRLPLAPTKDFAAALLGTVGPATKEVVDASEGRVRAGDDVGLSGLQKRYDARLAGTRGETVAVVDDRGERRTLFTADPVAGQPLRTTLDLDAQRLAQQVLSGVGPASALVAVRPSTGAIVAAASGPGSKGYNTATFGQYAPGSTFKVVSALALLRAGLTPASRVPCTPTTVVDGKSFKNYSDYPSSGLGRITLEDALANSCNTAFISQRDRLDGPSLGRAAAALGLGVDHDTGFPAFFGQVGTPASETQRAAGMIGQGTVLASPLAMATVVASVMEGSAVLPRLLPDVQVEQEAPAEPLTAAEARALRTMMRAVVERGSGRLLADLPGTVLAKTGTAEFGERPPLPTHAWMVAGRGDLAVAVFVERGDSGSGTAGPLLRRFLEQVRVP